MAKKNDLKNSMSAGLTGGLDSLIQSTAGQKEAQKPKKAKTVHCNFVMDETYHQNLKLIAIRKGDSLNQYCKRLYLTTWIKTVPCYNSVSGIYRANTPQKKFSRKKVRKKHPYTSKSILKMRFPIKNPLAGLILRMFNLPTGTILIKRLRLLPH